jgi:hypothetical protein
MTETSPKRVPFWRAFMPEPNEVIAWATVVNVVVSAALFLATCRTAQIAQQVFEAGNRPSVGVASISAIPDSARHILSSWMEPPRSKW